METMLIYSAISCRKLWAKVLKRAELDAAGVRVYGSYGYRGRQRIMEEALEWFTTNRQKADDVGSFLYVCDVLGLNPKEERKRVLSMIGKAPKGAADQRPVSDILISFRRRNRLSQKQVGRMVGCCGSTIGNIERGVINAGRYLKKKIRAIALLQEAAATGGGQ